MYNVDEVLKEIAGYQHKKIVFNVAKQKIPWDGNVTL
jgi:hypothetical protein